jgi:hypothetical protein
MCAICQKPVAVPGIDGLPVRTAEVTESWVHHGACLQIWSARHIKPCPAMAHERVLELLERARAAGRLIEREP